MGGTRLNQILQNDLLVNILKYSEDIGKCAKQLTTQIREIIGARLVTLIEAHGINDFSIAGTCPERRRSFLETRDGEELIRHCLALQAPETIFPGNGPAGVRLAELGMGPSFVVPLSHRDKNLGVLLVLDMIELHNTGAILEGLKNVSSVLSLIMYNSFLYRNMEDLVAQKTAALRQSEELYRLLFSNAGDAIMIFDSGGNALDANRAALDMLEYSKDELLTMNSMALNAPEEQPAVSERRSHLKKTGSHFFETVLLTKSGRRVPVEVSAGYFEQQGKGLALTVSRDVSERKRLEEYRLAREAAEAASLAKSVFLSYMTHELRTPLNSVIVLTGVLSRRLLGKIPEEEYGYLEVIDRNGKHLLDFINNILSLSRIEAGREELVTEEFHLEGVARELVELLRPQAELKGLTLELSIIGPLPPLISDRQKCRHILQNLLANAVKFTEHGGVSVAVEQVGTGLSVAVTDTGIGIDSAFLPFVFDEFRQADNSIARAYGGTGLGLSIAKKYAELLQGDILVRSTSGEGSTFIFTVPLRLDASGEDSKHEN